MRLSFPKELASPIRYVLPSLATVLENIAPESAAGVEEMAGDIWLCVVESPAYFCRTAKDIGVIIVSTRVLETLWAHAYAYWVFYDRVGKDNSRKGQDVDLAADVVTLAAMNLLRWSLNRWNRDSPQVWPRDLPSPQVAPLGDSYEFAASQLCLAAAGYIFHHELAHSYLGHSRFESADDEERRAINIDQERDADYAAADWILDRGVIDPRQRLFRLLGIALALLEISSVDIHRGRRGSLNHPRSYERLSNVLSRFVDKEEHGVWDFVCKLLLLHLENSQVEVPVMEYSTPYECVEKCIQALVDAIEE